MKLWTEIYTTSEYGLDILSKNETRQGDKCEANAPRVHSVYHKTINLSFPGALLGLQCDGSPLAPTSLICALTEKELEMSQISVGMPVCVKGQAIFIPMGCFGKEYVFSFKCAEIVDLRLKPLGGGKLLHEAYENIKLAVIQSPANGFNQLSLFSGHGAGHASAPLDGCGREPHFLPLEVCSKAQTFPSFSSYAEVFLQEAGRFFHRGDWDNAAKALARLIGLGIGLTPSGDDFLCGAIAGFILLDRTGHPLYRKLEACIQENLDRTNGISRSFLTCALKGQFSLPVINIKSYRSALDLYTAFSMIGHSSGIDTLCGILYLFSLFHTKEKKHFNII